MQDGGKSGEPCLQRVTGSARGRITIGVSCSSARLKKMVCGIQRVHLAARHLDALLKPLPCLYHAASQLCPLLSHATPCCASGEAQAQERGQRQDCGSGMCCAAGGRGNAEEGAGGGHRHGSVQQAPGPRRGEGASEHGRQCARTGLRQCGSSVVSEAGMGALDWQAKG